MIKSRVYNVMCMTLPSKIISMLCNYADDKTLKRPNKLYILYTNIIHTLHQFTLFGCKYNTIWSDDILVLCNPVLSATRFLGRNLLQITRTHAVLKHQLLVATLEGEGLGIAGCSGDGWS